MKIESFRITSLLAAIVTLVSVVSCGSGPEQKKEQSATVDKKEKPAPEKETVKEKKRPPIINIMDTLAIKRTVLYMRDSAANFDRISLKLGEIYGVKLAAILKKNNLKMTGAPMAWYTTMKPPYYFEAGVPVDKKPSKIPSNAYLREIGTDSVVVAHFYGTYDQMPLAYDALKDWIKDRKKKIKGRPYEVYVDDPVDKDGKMKDPYKVQTDVVFTWK